MPDKSVPASRPIPPLRDLQRWVQGFIVDPAADDVVLAREKDAAQALVAPSATLTGVERVSIYRDMYLMRMDEALAGDYPTLKRFVGDDRWNQLVHDYVIEHPSRSYTLNRLSDRLPEFVRKMPGLPRREFAYELARLELAITQVFDAPASPVLDPQAIASIPPDQWGSLRLVPIEAFQLLELLYPANAYLEAVRLDREPPPIRRRSEYVAVARCNYQMFRLSLTQPQFSLLKSLADGAALEWAIKKAVQRFHLDETAVFQWFARWMAEGLFSRIA